MRIYLLILFGLSIVLQSVQYLKDFYSDFIISPNYIKMNGKCYIHYHS